jgi:signal recognition particle receptor subunit beta
MALINYASREINAKIVYYGPGLGGKTTNIKYIYTKLNPSIKGKLISLATELDRTLFFDFLPVDLGTIRGFKTRFHNMMDNLKTYNLFLEKIPFVIQYNKRDLPNITSVDELQKIMNSQNTHPYFEAVATQGIGVFETLKEVCKHVLKILA